MRWKDTIFELYEIVRPRLLALGVKLTTLAYKRERIDNASEHEAKACANWLQAYVDTRLKALDYAIDLVDKDVWERYASMGIEGLREQVMRQKAEKAFVYEWKFRPDLLRRVSNEPDGKRSSERGSKKSKGARKKGKGPRKQSEQNK